METLVNRKVVFNPLSKTILTTSVVPVCDFQSTEDANPIAWRNAIVNTYGDEILTNGGELSIADNGDVNISRQSEELYWVDISNATFTSKDWYFMNMSISERDIMSDNEWTEHQIKITNAIMKKYLTEEEKGWLYTNPTAYYKRIKEITDNSVCVTISVEATLNDWLEKVFPRDMTFIQSDLIGKVIKLIKIRQLSIGAFTDIRTQLFGVAKNFYPFCYFKNNYVYDLCNFPKAPKKISDINLSPYDPDQMNVYWKQISSNKKNLMSICKWTNTEYYVVPEGEFKSYMYDSATNKKYIGDTEMLDGFDIEILNKGGYTEYNVTIDGGLATERLQSKFIKFLKDKYGGDYDYFGTSSWKNTTSQSRFLNEYGITIPMSKLSVQNQRIFKFEEGDKFVVYFCFYNLEKASGGSITVTEDQYFGKEALADTQSKPKVNYVGTSKVWTQKNYQAKELLRQPLVEKDDFKNDLKMLDKEIWQKQEFEYDETHMNSSYVKGDFYYLVRTKQKSSAGFIGVTCVVSLKVPGSCCYDENTGKITYTSTNKTVTLKSVLSVADMDDVYQIKDTIAVTKYDMLNKLYTYLDMWIKRDLEIPGTPPGGVNEAMRQVMIYGALRECLVDVDWYTKQVLFNEILPKKTLSVFKVFPKTFNVINEEIDYFTKIEDVIESSYCYELKTFSGARQQNQSYTTNSRIQYVPTPLPFDVKDMSNSNLTIYFNGLVPTVSADYEQGGGMIGKKEFKLMQDEYLKYIVTKSREFKSGLSNSEIMKFEIETFNTDGLDKLYDNAFPTLRKEVNLNFRAIASSPQDASWQSVFLSNKLITNMTYDHNYLSQTDQISIMLLIYDREV